MCAARDLRLQQVALVLVLDLTSDVLLLRDLFSEDEQLAQR